MGRDVAEFLVLRQAPGHRGHVDPTIIPAATATRSTYTAWQMGEATHQARACLTDTTNKGMGEATHHVEACLSDIPNFKMD